MIDCGEARVSTTRRSRKPANQHCRSICGHWICRVDLHCPYCVGDGVRDLFAVKVPWRGAGDVWMTTVRYVYWRDGDMWLGYVVQFPDYMTQGKGLAELEENLTDIYADLASGLIPGVC